MADGNAQPAIKPVIPEVLSSHRYTVWLPNMEVRKHRPAITVVAYSALRGTPPRDSFEKMRGALPSQARYKAYGWRRTCRSYPPTAPPSGSPHSLPPPLRAGPRAGRPGERADADVFHVVTQQAWIGMRNDQADNQNSEHVEQQDTPEHLTHRARNVLLRVFGFTGRDTNQLRAGRKPTIIATPIIAEAPANGASPMVQLLQPAGSAPENTHDHRHADE